MRWILITINISHNSWSSPHTISHFSGSQPAPRGIFPILTVLGFGVDGAVLGADFSHQHRAEEVGAALELGTDPPAEICHLVRRAHDLHGRPVRLPPVPRVEYRTQSPIQQNPLVLQTRPSSDRERSSPGTSGRVSLLRMQAEQV